MKSLLTILAVCGAMSVTAYAEQSASESATATAHDAGRAIKKGTNRVKEAVCMKGDAKCLAEKAKHRAEEAGEKVSDKAKEIKDKVDSDSKPTY